MKNREKSKNFFEGWYFKHQYENFNIAFIPGINKDKYGTGYSFIQVITDSQSYYIKYDYKDFSISKDKKIIRIKDSIFSEKGIVINIVNKDVMIKGKLDYAETTPIKYDIMGPFSVLPFMECNHGVISLYHKVNGKLSINNEEIIIKEGKGYIEKDWGRSFPESYLWIQSNDFKDGKVSIMVSIADIPMPIFNFKGCIAIVYYKGKEYRLATYNGVKIISYNENGLRIKRGKYKLEIEIKENYPQKLMAPDGGEMTRMIYENISCNATFKFHVKDNKLFELKSNNTSFEYVV